MHAAAAAALLSAQPLIDSSWKQASRRCKVIDEYFMIRRNDDDDVRACWDMKVRPRGS